MVNFFVLYYSNIYILSFAFICHSILGGHVKKNVPFRKHDADFRLRHSHSGSFAHRHADLHVCG